VALAGVQHNLILVMKWSWVTEAELKLNPRVMLPLIDTRLFSFEIERTNAASEFRCHA
jgi:hypothetical protein